MRTIWCEGGGCHSCQGERRVPGGGRTYRLCAGCGDFRWQGQREADEGMGRTALHHRSGCGSGGTQGKGGGSGPGEGCAGNLYYLLQFFRLEQKRQCGQRLWADQRYAAVSGRRIFHLWVRGAIYPGQRILHGRFLYEWQGGGQPGRRYLPGFNYTL